MEFNWIEGVEKLPAVQWKIDKHLEDQCEEAQGAFGKVMASTRNVKSI